MGRLDDSSQASAAVSSARLLVVRPWVLGVLVFATVSLGTASVLMAGQLLASFQKLQYLRIYPLGYQPLATQSVHVACGKPVLAIYGDSRAEMWGNTPPAAALSVVNLGHGATTSSQLLAALLVDPPPMASVALLQIGINDLHPLGSLPGEAKAITAQLRQNYRRIVGLLGERSGTVVLTTIFPPGPVPLTRRPLWDDGTLREIEAMNDEIRSYAIDGRVVVLDAHHDLAGRGGLLESTYSDVDFFLHVNPLAYRTLNERLLALLATRKLEPAECGLGKGVKPH